MSDADWDADDFEPVVKPAGPPKAFQDKWEGEDEDDDVKAAWDASSEEEDNSKGSEEGKAVQRKKKKKLHEILAEKEAARYHSYITSALVGGEHCVLKWVLRGHFLGIKMPQ